MLVVRGLEVPRFDRNEIFPVGVTPSLPWVIVAVLCSLSCLLRGREKIVEIGCGFPFVFCPLACSGRLYFTIPPPAALLRAALPPLFPPFFWY